MNRFWRDKKIVISVAVVICLVGIGIGVAVAMSSDNYDMPISADSGGGDERSSANYHLIDAAGQSTAIGVSSSGSYTLYAGYIAQVASLGTGDELMVEIYVNLQGTGRPEPEGWNIPLNIGFYPPGSDDATLVNPGSALYYFPGTGSYTIAVGDTRSMVLVGPVNSGTYDITADSETTLLSVKKNVGVW